MTFMNQRSNKITQWGLIIIISRNGEKSDNSVLRP